MAPSARALREFVSEAQEIVDSLNRNLLQMDEQRGSQGVSFDPELVNECFRGVHSLKGLSGMFGIEQMTRVSHRLENLLDSLRLGRRSASPQILDLLFESVELFGMMIAAAADGNEVGADKVTGYIGRLDVAAAPGAVVTEQDTLTSYEFAPSVLSVLTEYEEHRLLENIEQGRTIYELSAAFDLMSIDTGLELLKERGTQVGEVITYLPSAKSLDDTTIQLDVLVGSTSTLDEVREAFKDVDVEIRKVGKPRESDAGHEAEAEPAEKRPPSPPDEPRVPVVAPVADELGTIRSVSQTVRVDIRKLDSLMNTVSEMSIVQTGIEQILESLSDRIDLIDDVRALTREMRTLSRRLADMQNGILEVRMVPLRQVFDKLSRVVRKLSRESGKEIRLEISGADTELDKLIVEELSDPLMHIIRNAIDHGIEPPAERVAAGKPVLGTIVIDARQQGSRVLVTVSDDGGGIDEHRVAEVGVRRGVIEAAQAQRASSRELLNLLFLPGMSTREQATELSGRGVGLDVVKTNISRLSGIIDLSSTRGEGTELVITLPITLAIIQALVVRIAGQVYAVPLNSVLESLMIEPGEIKTVEGREVYSLRNHTLVLSRLEETFDLERDADDPRPDKQYVVVTGLAQHRLGLVVDELIGERDIVIKAMGSTLSEVPGIAGATELSHQTIVLVLDVADLVEEALLRGSSAEAA